MYRFHRALLVSLFFCLPSCAGCSHTNGYDWRERQWAKSPHLDRVQVVVLDAREEGRVPGDPVVAPKADVEKWTREALQKIPGTVVVGDAANAGKAANGGSANMLCRVTIGKAGNRFGIGVTLMWDLTACLNYDIEMIDIPTGELRFKAVRTVTDGGLYNVLPLTDIPTLYQRDLAHVLHFATYPVDASPNGPTSPPTTRP